MKRHSSLTLAVCIPLLLFPGCLEEHVRTTISADGSSERTISLKLPSKELPENAFPTPSNATWSVEWKETGEKDSVLKYEYIAKKSFPTPDDLHQEYASLPDTGIIGIQISIEKKFEWFFTYLTYQEIYSYRNPFGNVPVSNYLTTEEIARYQYNEKNDSLEEKVRRWIQRDQFEEFYRPLLAEAQRRNDPRLPVSLLIEKKEACFARAEAVDSTNKKAADSNKIPLNNAQDILKLMTGVLRTEAILGFGPVADQALKAIEEKENKMKHPDGWTYTVQMPGLILETSSNVVEGNTMTWKFDPNKVKVADYAMHATSRVANTWAFIVTGVAALMILLMAVRASFRRR